MTVFKNITIEPVLFFMSLVGSMDGVSVGQLLIDKVCHNQFNYTEEVCENLVADDYKEENANVQNYVAQYKVNITFFLIPEKIIIFVF